MGAPQTLPANFTGWDPPAAASPPPATLPANFNGWDDASKTAQKPIAPYLEKDADEVAGVLGGAVKSLAKVSGPNTVYEMLRQHFPELNLKPGLGMPTANEVGAAGVGMMLPGAEGEAGAEVPKTETPAAAAPKAASSAASVLDHPAVSPWVDALKAELKSKIPGYTFLKTLRDSAEGLTKGQEPPKPPTPGVPETNGVPWGSGGQGPIDLRGKVIPPASSQLPSDVAAAPDAATPEAPQSNVPAPYDRRSMPVHGDSALRQILTGQDNANLLKIAKSRGLNVTRESQLKPGVADQLLINKIVNDFDPDELDEVGAKFLQNESKHNFGDIGPEAWKTMSLQTYFPDVKIPASVLKRTQTAIGAAAAKTTPADDDLEDLLQQSLAQAQKNKQ
jgi:hypothetical protein